jgi:steroid 5-alpha reductase family enzyme
VRKVQASRSKHSSGFEVALGYLAAVAAMWWLLETRSPALTEFFARGGNHAELLRVFASHVAAALIIFALSVFRRNSSFFDPYWSVIPIPTVLWFGDLSTAAAWGARRWLVVAFVVFWGGRLTYNWWRGWQGLHHEDWRYVDLRAKAGRLFLLVNLFGIHLFPCVLVFAGCIPMSVSMRPDTGGLAVLDLLALFVTVTALAFETIGDRQLWDWRQSSPPREAYMRDGLWKYTRHPNYFGETTFWWGMWLFALAASSVATWMVVGAVAMTCLFVFISIPMIEKRTLAKRPGYAEHIEKTSMFIPWPPRT